MTSDMAARGGEGPEVPVPVVVFGGLGNEARRGSWGSPTSVSMAAALFWWLPSFINHIGKTF